MKSCFNNKSRKCHRAVSTNQRPSILSSAHSLDYTAKQISTAAQSFTFLRGFCSLNKHSCWENTSKICHVVCRSQDLLQNG